jgi:hypothetical protein
MSYKAIHIIIVLCTVVWSACTEVPKAPSTAFVSRTTIHLSCQRISPVTGCVGTLQKLLFLWTWPSRSPAGTPRITGSSEVRGLISLHGTGPPLFMYNENYLYLSVHRKTLQGSLVLGGSPDVLRCFPAVSYEVFEFPFSMPSQFSKQELLLLYTLVLDHLFHLINI